VAILSPPPHPVLSSHRKPPSPPPPPHSSVWHQTPEGEEWAPIYTKFTALWP
jgi:hypothetical protein